MLNKSLFTPLNVEINELSDSQILVCRDRSGNRRVECFLVRNNVTLSNVVEQGEWVGVRVMEGEGEGKSLTFKSPLPPPGLEGSTRELVDIEVLMIGDLKFFMILMGREGCASYRCPWCTWSKSSKFDSNSEEWTYNALCKKHLMITTSKPVSKKGGGSRQWKPEERQGVVSKPLLKVPVLNYIPSLLHISLGLSLDVWKAVEDYCKEYIQDLPEDIAKLYKAVRVAEKKEEKMDKLMMDWEKHNNASYLD